LGTVPYNPETHHPDPYHARQPMRVQDDHNRRTSGRQPGNAAHRRRSQPGAIGRRRPLASSAPPLQAASRRQQWAASRRRRTAKAAERTAAAWRAAERSKHNPASHPCNIFPPPGRAGGRQLAHGRRDRRWPPPPEALSGGNLLQVYYNPLTIRRFLIKPRKVA